MINVNLLYDAKMWEWRPSRFWTRKKRFERRRLVWIKALGWTSLLLWLVGLLVLTVPNAPKVMYAVAPGMTTMMAEELGTTADVTKSQFGEDLYVPPRTLPLVDESLPSENRLIIPDLGVNAEIGEGSDWEEALRYGPWRVSDFGTPMDDNRPTIIAAHRFGYLAWSNQFRHERSFYNLPKLEVGDKIEIVWNQRKFTYEVYEGYTDTAIHPESYDGNLILYTCEVLNSDRRIIRVARLVNN